MEKVWIDHGFGAGAPGSDRSRDGDRGEQSNEYCARDDPKASHVTGNLSRDGGIGPITTRSANMALA